MKLTKKELRIVSGENSYRAMRAFFGSFALLIAIPCTLLACNMVRYYWAFFPDKTDDFWQLTKSMNWREFYPGVILFMIFYHIASHSHSRLAFIRHLKTHLEEDGKQSSEQGPSPYAKPEAAE